MSTDNKTFDDHFDHSARLNLEGERAVWIKNRAKINQIYKKVRKYIKNAGTACEVGVGDGYLLRLLCKSGLKVVGIDISKYLVKKLRNDFEKEGLEIELIQGDFSKINLKKDQFDLFFCLDVLEHIHDVGKAIENIKKSLCTGGLLIGTLPLHENLDKNMVMCPKCGHKFHRVGHHHSFDSIKGIRQLLGPQFKIIQTGEITSLSEVSDIFYYVLRKIRNYIFRKKTVSTVYFVAKLEVHAIGL